MNTLRLGKPVEDSRKDHLGGVVTATDGIAGAPLDEVGNVGVQRHGPRLTWGTGP